MITQHKRLLGGVAGAVLLAAVGGFSVARCTADPAADTQSGEKAEEDAEAHADSLPMTADAIRAADIAVEAVRAGGLGRSEEHTSELQSLMRSSYAVFCLKKQQK